MLVLNPQPYTSDNTHPCRLPNKLLGRQLALWFSSMNANKAAQVKNEICMTAKAMLNGTINYLAGTIEIERLRHEVGAYENDPDFMPFVAILSEIDQLGIGRKPERWPSDVVNATRLEIKQSISWAKEISLPSCEALTLRYETKK